MNEAETAAELRTGKLTIPRLNTHVEASGGSRTGLSIAAINNKGLWPLVAFYLIAMTVYGVLNSVLSVIFVVDVVTSSVGQEMPVHIPTSADVPATYNGNELDPCRGAFANPGCTYDLALTSLASQLVTNTPYNIAGVTFQSPNGTMGLPYWAMKHFADNVTDSLFDDEYRQYCLPVLDPHVIKCTEEPFVQAWGETNDTTAQYLSLFVYEHDYFAYDNFTKLHQIKDVIDMYKVVIDYPSNDTINRVRYRINDQGKGTMTVWQYPTVEQQDVTVITAGNSGGQGYASLIHQMLYGDYQSQAFRDKWPATKIAVKCKFSSLFNNNDHSSWRKVNFNMNGGVLRANVTEERCPNPRHEGFSGYSDLYYAIEGAAAILAGEDGYTKLLNNNTELGYGTDIFAGMSRLDAAVNKIYHLVQTSYSQTSYQYSMKNASIYSDPIIMTYYPHQYVIRIAWTPTTYIGLIFAIGLVLVSMLLALRWLLAQHRLHPDRDTWNLLRPVDLMAYSLAAYQDLIHDLNTIDHRKSAMREAHGMVLKEYPIHQGTASLINLVKSNPSTLNTRNPPSLNSTLVSPVSPIGTLEKNSQSLNQNLATTIEEVDSSRDSKESRHNLV